MESWRGSNQDAGTSGEQLDAIAGQQQQPCLSDEQEEQAIQQRDTDNIAIRSEVRQIQPVFNFHLAPVLHNGNYTDNSTNIENNSIGSIETSAGQSTQSGTAAGATAIGPSERALAEVITSLLQKILDETGQTVSGEVQGDGLAKTQQTNKRSEKRTPSVGNETTESRLATEQMLDSIKEDTKFGHDTVKLLTEAFETIIRHDDSGKSTWMLITEFRKERSALPSSFYANRKPLKKTFRKFWEYHQLKMAEATFESHLTDKNLKISALARICVKLSKQLLQRRKFNPTKRLLAKSEPGKITLDAGQSISMGEEFVSNKKYIHAIISFYMAAELYKIASNGDDSVFGIRKCSKQTRFAVEEMAKKNAMKSLVTENVIPLMQKMRIFLSSIQNSTRSSAVMCEAWCYYNIGICNLCCRDWDQYKMTNEAAVDLLQTEFNEDVNKYKIYGFCLNNAAAAFRKLGNIPKAIELCKKTLKAYENAQDWKSKSEQNEEIQRAKNNLMLCVKEGT